MEKDVKEEFRKFDGEKTRYELVPPKAIKAVAEVLTFGANKYGANNWINVDDPERYVGALMRHLEAYRSGEINDPESGFSHLHHAATNVAFLIELGYEPNTWSK